MTKASDDQDNDLLIGSKARASSGGPCPCGKQEYSNHPVGWCHAEDHKRNTKEIHRSHVKSLSEQYAESMVGHLKVSPPEPTRAHPVYSGLAYDGGEFSPTVPRYGGGMPATTHYHYENGHHVIKDNKECCGTRIGDTSVLTEAGAKRLLDEGKRLADAMEPKIKSVQGFATDNGITGEDIGKSSNATTGPQDTASSPKGLDSSHKIPVNLCPASAIIAIALVIQQGHKTPGRTHYNWRVQPISWMMYDAAIERHRLKARDGEDFDEDLSKKAGIPIRHEWAAMASMAIVEDARQAGTLVDDRPIKGGAAEFLNRVTPKKP